MDCVLEKKRREERYSPYIENLNKANMSGERKRSREKARRLEGSISKELGY